MSTPLSSSVLAEAMDLAIGLGQRARQIAPPNPWVGAVILDRTGALIGQGSTRAPGEAHAEVVALADAGDAANGATLVVTLEPCGHHGRTPPCVDAIIAAGIERVVVGVEDPDPNVRGAGIEQLRNAGIDVIVGVERDAVEEGLRAYLHHRTTGLPYVVVKLAATLDGRTAAPDGSSKWITAEPARQDVAALRARCDAILVGAGTVRRDDPALTARTTPAPHRQPQRFVLGEIPDGAKVLPAESLNGDLERVLADLGQRGIIELLVEGGATTAHAFMAAGLVNRVVIYFAPAFMGGDDGFGLLAGPGAPSIEGILRGRFVSVVQIGDDLRVEVEL
jgi:diaminohydroxyphosphoribosylaminopyrimidine deaminase / 5-amino-6-(5-phosphoribosylamino)uracil reductase